MKEKKSKDKSIRSRDVKKHRNDVLRLEDMLPYTKLKNVPDSVIVDIKLFTYEIKKELDILKNLSIKDRTMEDIINHFNTVYGV